MADFQWVTPTKHCVYFCPHTTLRSANPSIFNTLTQAKQVTVYLSPLFQLQRLRDEECDGKITNNYELVTI
jgi:hypothetical protein